MKLAWWYFFLYSNFSKYSSVRVADDDAIENEIAPFIRTVAAFIKLADKEVALMRKVLPEQYYNKVFDLVGKVKKHKITENQNLLA